jgi:uncharacterized protein
MEGQARLTDHMDTPLTKHLLREILRRYALPLGGTHGVSHWARVLENGRRLAARTRARLDVVELFAVFHDSRRLNEAIDRGHGQRGAELASALHERFFRLDDAGLRLLLDACGAHTDGLTDADVTVQTCWDSDRLDLPRIGIPLRLEYLCTPAARDPALRDWASGRAKGREVPDLIETEWAIPLGGLFA